MCVFCLLLDQDPHLNSINIKSSSNVFSGRIDESGREYLLKCKCHGRGRQNRKCPTTKYVSREHTCRNLEHTYCCQKRY